MTVGPLSVGPCSGDDDTCGGSSGFVPVELGVPFTIVITGFVQSPNYAIVGQSDAAFTEIVSVTAYEVGFDGEPGGGVQIMLVPEPDSFALAFTGLCAGVIFATRSRKNRRARPAVLGGDKAILRSR